MICAAKEDLISEVGPIEQLKDDPKDRFLVETTVGRLNVGRLFFANWFLDIHDPGRSIGVFFSKLFARFDTEKVFSSRRKLSVGLSMFDENENLDEISDLIVEKLIEMIFLVAKCRVEVCLVFRREQNDFHEKFVSSLRRIKSNNEESSTLFFSPRTSSSRRPTDFHSFSFSSSAIRIELFSEQKKKLDLFTRKIGTKIDRFSSTLTVGQFDFDEWKQSSIDRFFSLCCRNSVFPRVEKGKFLFLEGPSIKLNFLRENLDFLRWKVYSEKCSGRDTANFSAEDKTSVCFLCSTDESSSIGRIIDFLDRDLFHCDISTGNDEQSCQKISASSTVVFCLSERFFCDDSIREATNFVSQSAKNVENIFLDLCWPSQWFRDLFHFDRTFFFAGSTEFLDFQAEKLSLKLVRLSARSSTFSREYFSSFTIFSDS